MRRAICRLAGALAGMALLLPCGAAAGWEAGVKAGFDSNIDRSVDDGENDLFFAGYMAYIRQADGERRLDWTVSAVVEGGAYEEFSGLNYGSASVSPGLLWILRPGWTLHLSPFLQGKEVSDSAQSAWAFGARVDLRQELSRRLYLGEFGSWTDSRADAETFSFTEIAAGAAIGVNWTGSVFTEIGYRYSHGDSFVSFGTALPPEGGEGGPGGRGFRGGTDPIQSSAFGKEVVKDRMDAHAFELSAGVDWSASLFTVASFTWQTMRGEVGTAESLSGYAGAGYRF